MDFEVLIKCDVFPTFTTKLKSADVYDFRLAIAKVMGDWNNFCMKQRKNTTPEVRKLWIEATVI